MFYLERGSSLSGSTFPPQPCHLPSSDPPLRAAGGQFDPELGKAQGGLIDIKAHRLPGSQGAVRVHRVRATVTVPFTPGHGARHPGFSALVPVPTASLN